MCDTYVALANSTKNGDVIFGKNSDRLSNEAQLITYSPSNQHPKGSMVKCTHVEIPQISKTAEIIMSQPYWMFGCEMGANEHGVVIGNEAVATKEPLNEAGLLGMDLLRLGLERGKTAKEALNVITALLEKHGQGGAHNKKGLNYHNTMILADPKEAYVLETAGEWWIVEVVEDVRSISNNISIRGKGDLRRKGIIQHAIEQGYCKDDDDFDFKLNFSASPLPETFPVDSRDGCSLNQLHKNKGKISVKMMMDFLRTHEPATICMHGRGNRSVGSQVSSLSADGKNIHWFTGSTITCFSVFKPHVFPAAGQKFWDLGPHEQIDKDWFWTRHDKHVKPLSKSHKKEIPERSKLYQQIDTIESSLLNKVDELLVQEQFDVTTLHELNVKAWKRAEGLIS